MIRKHNCVNICEDMTLTKEQTSAIKKLSKLRAGALFMEMGTGKTRTMK